MMKKHKKMIGFTLVELTIAVAIITILAAVLIPKVSTAKKEARLKGLDSNIRYAVSLSEVMLNNYNANTIDQVEPQLAAKLNSGDSSKDSVNPITKATGCADFGTEEMDYGAAFAYYAEPAEDEVGDSAYENLGENEGEINEDFSGIILFDAYIDDNNKLRIKFVPFDEKAIPIKSRVVETTG